MTIRPEPGSVTLPRWFVIAVIAALSAGFGTAYKVAVDVQAQQVVIAYRLERIERQLGIPAREESGLGVSHGGGLRFAPPAEASPR